MKKVSALLVAAALSVSSVGVQAQTGGEVAGGAALTTSLGTMTGVAIFGGIVFVAVAAAAANSSGKSDNNNSGPTSTR